MTWNALSGNGEKAVTAWPGMVCDISRLSLSYCFAQHFLQLRSYLKLSAYVGRERHQCPFAFHFPHAAQAEAIKPASRLDVPEHRFHDRFAAAVHFPARFGTQLALHAVLGRAVLRNPPARGRLGGLRVLVFPNGDVELNPADGFRGDVRFTKVASIGRQAARPTPGRLLNGGH